LVPSKSPGATSAQTSSNTSSRLLSGSPTSEVGGTGSFKTLSLHFDVVNSSPRAVPEQKYWCTSLGSFTFVGGRPWSPKEVHYYPPFAIPNGFSRAVLLDKKTTEHEPRFLPPMTAFPAPILPSTHFLLGHREQLLQRPPRLLRKHRSRPGDVSGSHATYDLPLRLSSNSRRR
jgi:hypothetical protein